MLTTNYLQVLENNKLIRWLLDERFPFFRQSHLYFDYKLNCKLRETKLKISENSHNIYREIECKYSSYHHHRIICNYKLNVTDKANLQTLKKFSLVKLKFCRPRTTPVWKRILRPCAGKCPGDVPLQGVLVWNTRGNCSTVLDWCGANEMHIG